MVILYLFQSQKINLYYRCVEICQNNLTTQVKLTIARGLTVCLEMT